MHAGYFSMCTFANHIGNYFFRDDFAAAWMNLGIVQASLHKNNSAEKSYYTALKHRRRYPDCYYNLGNMVVISICLFIPLFKRFSVQFLSKLKVHIFNCFHIPLWCG